MNAEAAGEPNDPLADFATLLKRAAAQDAAAQAQLCQHYEPKVRIVARVLLGPALRSHFDSMDLVQSVHRSLLVGLRHEKFDISTPEKLIALASTIVRRKVVAEMAAGAAADPPRIEPERFCRPGADTQLAFQPGWRSSEASRVQRPD